MHFAHFFLNEQALRELSLDVDVWEWEAEGVVASRKPALHSVTFIPPTVV